MVIIKLLQKKSFNYYIHWRNSISSQAELDTLKGVYALYDALDAAYLQVMVIAIPTSKKTAPWQA